MVSKNYYTNLANKSNKYVNAMLGEIQKEEDKMIEKSLSQIDPAMFLGLNANAFNETIKKIVAKYEALINASKEDSIQRASTTLIEESVKNVKK